MKSTPLMTGILSLCILIASIDVTFSVEKSVQTGSLPAIVTPETLNARKKEIEESSKLDEATKNKLIELIGKSLSQLSAAESYKTSADAFIQARKTAPKQTQEIRKELSQAIKNAPPVALKISPSATIPDIEQMLLKEKANHAAVEAKHADLKERLELQAERPVLAQKRLIEAKQRKEQLVSELKRQPPENELPWLVEVRRWAVETKITELRNEIQMLDQELLSQAVRIQLLTVQEEKTARSAERLARLVNLLEERLNEERRSETIQATVETEAAKEEARGKHPLVQELAEQNSVLSEELTTRAKELESTSLSDDKVNKQAKRISDDFRRTKQKLEVAGLSQALGQVLLEQRRSLPDAGLFRKKARERAGLVAEVSLHQIQIDEERRRLQNSNDYLVHLTQNIPATEAANIQGDLLVLVDSRRELVDKLIEMDEAYLRALSDLDFADRKLLDVVDAYDEFLTEHLLWVRSSPPPNLSILESTPKQLAWLFSVSNWLDTIETFTSRLTRSPILILILVLFTILQWKSRFMHITLLETGKIVGKPSTDNMTTTFIALGLSLLLAAKWPLLLAGAGWQLQQSMEITVFTHAVSEALLWLSLPFFYLRSFRILCTPGGLMAAHFRWPASVLQYLRRGFYRFMLTFLPALFIAAVVLNRGVVLFGGGLGRLALVVTLIALAIFFYRIFGPHQVALVGLLSQVTKRKPGRQRYLWLVLTVAVPLILIALAFYGYVYTVAILTVSLLNTLWFILALIIIQQLVLRWLLLVQRRISYQTAQESRAAVRAAEEHAKDAVPSSEELVSAVEEPELDLAALSQQSRKLLNFFLLITGIIGIWIIWSDVLPAFAILDNIILWHYTSIVSGEEQILPVTLTDTILAVLIIIGVAFTTRNLPALLEIFLLQHLSLTSGNRYTISTLSTYILIAIGIVLVFNTLGGNWSQIQWMFAALSLGIGFGLQEIVANFISGIIILFEQPIRVGDFVTVGETDGTVTRIRIRATTILTRDRKELLVPNKEFITGRLLNWSLSDQTTRIVIPVGVAYGSNVKLAMRLMNETATENKHILSDPEPFVTFESFGDNSLTLVLRCYVEHVDYRLTTISSLHEAINERLHTAGISIAFPQRDIHLDTSQPLDIRIHRDNDKQQPET